MFPPSAFNIASNAIDMKVTYNSNCISRIIAQIGIYKEASIVMDATVFMN
jgi:hypothetical protein